LFCFRELDQKSVCSRTANTTPLSFAGLAELMYWVNQIAIVWRKSRAKKGAKADRLTVTSLDH